MAGSKYYYFYPKNLQVSKILLIFAAEKIELCHKEYVTIKNASRKVLKKMRQIGEEKAQRLQSIQERWDAGEYKDVEIVQL